MMDRQALSEFFCVSGVLLVLLDFRRSFTRSATLYWNGALLVVLNNIILVNSAVINH